MGLTQVEDLVCPRHQFLVYADGHTEDSVFKRSRHVSKEGEGSGHLRHYHCPRQAGHLVAARATLTVKELGREPLWRR